MEGMESSSPVGGKSERSPWMYTSVLLGVLLVASMGFNFSLTGDIISGKVKTPSDGTGPIVQQPTQQPQLPGEPAGPIRVSADNDPVKGNANAPVTIIEFSDFQCPFCGRFYEQTLPQLETNYINTGKVKLVFRDFPLSFHPEAQPAAEAAECSKEQGKFWEMHDKIFDNQATMSAASYKQWAQELGMNVQQFNACIDSGKYKAEIQGDLNDGQTAGVSGTPTLFVGNDQDGYQRIVGAQPFAAFQTVIDSYLN